jgi:hypothetical protein
VKPEGEIVDGEADWFGRCWACCVVGTVRRMRRLASFGSRKRTRHGRRLYGG